jgi:hypothetical protein
MRAILTPGLLICSKKPSVQGDVLLCPEALHDLKIFPKSDYAALRYQPIRWIVLCAMTEADADHQPSIREDIDRR